MGKLLEDNLYLCIWEMGGGGELHAVVQFLFIITKTLKGSIHLEVPEFCSDWRGTTLILDVNCILKALKHDHKRKI